MTSELLSVLEYFEKEKGINREVMLDALSNALLSASRKSVGPARNLRIDIDPAKGTIKAIAQLVVVERVANKNDEISLALARTKFPAAQLGEEVDWEVTPENFGRIAAQTAKQAMMQRLRQAEKAMIYDEFKDRAGDIVSGVVRRFERSDVIIDLGKFEAVMPSRERVSTEDYNIGDRLRAYVVAVENQARGPEIILSRSHPNFVRRLFESEVSEIADHTVEIRAIAREAGYRTKIAVNSNDEKVDPVGACVGLRGARVKNIVRELNNEKVDIIRWNDNPQEFVQDALKPAKLKSIDLNHEGRVIRVTVEEEELSKAIGRRGQNARLTSRLIGWDVQIEKDESAHEAFEHRVLDAAKVFTEKLGIGEDAALALVRGGLPTPEALAEVDVEDIAGILGVEMDEAEVILAKAGGKPKQKSEAVEEEPEAVEEEPEAVEEEPAAVEEEPEALEEEPEAVEEEPEAVEEEPEAVEEEPEAVEEEPEAVEEEPEAVEEEPEAVEEEPEAVEEEPEAVEEEPEPESKEKTEIADA